MSRNPNISLDPPVGIVAIHPHLFDEDANRLFKKLWEDFIKKNRLRICVAAFDTNEKEYHPGAEYYLKTATHVFRTWGEIHTILEEDKDKLEKFERENNREILLLMGGRLLGSCVDRWAYDYLSRFRIAILEDVCRHEDRGSQDHSSLVEFKARRIQIIDCKDIIEKGLERLED